MTANQKKFNSIRAYSSSTGMRAIFKKKGKKMLKKGKKWQHIWKFGQKCSKCEDILEKGKWLRAIIAHNKLLEKVLSILI